MQQALTSSPSSKESILHYEDIVSSKKKPGKQYKVQSIQQDNLDRILDWTISTSRNVDTWSIVAGLDEAEMAQSYYSPMLKKSMEQGLLFMFSEVDSGEIVGYIAGQDFYNDGTGEDFTVSGIDLFDRMYLYLQNNVMNMIELPTQPYQMLFIDMIAVDPKHLNSGVAWACVTNLFKKHPIVSKASIIADAVNMAAQTILDHLGFNTFWRMKYKDFEHIEGLEKFTNIPKIAKSIGLDPRIYESYGMSILDRRPQPRL